MKARGMTGERDINTHREGGGGGERGRHGACYEVEQHCEGRTEKSLWL